MKKIKNTKLYIIAVTIFSCMVIALIIRFLWQNREPEALVFPVEAFQNSPVFYSDSTYRASSWLWEFGNGDISDKQEGEYVFRETGTYQIRLTVDETLQKTFIVNVRKPVTPANDSLVQIVAPRLAMQGEYIVFRGLGYAGEWRWSFGETRLTDAREQVTIYTYTKPGTYQVELMTEYTRYPIIHSITVLPKYREDEDDQRSRMGNDIRERLQAIVDGKHFGTNYEHILRYMCGSQNAHNALITINETKVNDLYSYCQGLKIIDRKNTTILEVIVFPDENNPDCLKTFKVMQVKNGE
jgi:hypothetical protein